MPITEKIREFLREQPSETLITRGDLLAFGHRIAVDNAIYHLVNKTGEMVRVARGLFVKKERLSPVTVLEAVTAKCKRFGKQLISAAECIASELGISNSEPATPIFATSGRTSSFLFQGRRITTKGTSPRKMALGDGLPGRVIRALIHVGKGGVTHELVGRATRGLKAHERAAIAQSSAMMPGWLTDFFVSSSKIEGSEREVGAAC